MSRTTIETNSGLFFDYLDPRPEQVCIDDIAHALANTSRFGGHCAHFYSVAEHCCLVRQLVREAGHPEFGLAALLHDAHEAYLGDVPTPLKSLLGNRWPQLVHDVDHAIVMAVGDRMWCGDFHAPRVVWADALCLRYEAAVLKVSRGTGEHWGFDEPLHRDKFIRCHESAAAKWRFLRDYAEEVSR